MKETMMTIGLRSEENSLLYQSPVSFYVDPSIHQNLILTQTSALYILPHLTSSFASIIITTVMRSHLTIKRNYGSPYDACADDIWGHF